VTRYVDSVLADAATGATIPFAQVRLGDGSVVGVTRFLGPRHRPGAPFPYAVEIGGTWLAASAQRTGINVEAKLLLLGHAFDTWHAGRVEFKTDARNARSRTAIAALGAVFEGVLRNWQPSHAVGEHDRLRDSAMYSITAAEWPAVRDGLERRLARSP
jgi:RimJ/RimL family protein N-acetyltransferase